MSGIVQFFQGVVGLILLAMVAGCATTIPKESLSLVKTIAIKSNLGADPNYTKVGTTVFGNEYGKFKSEVSSEYIVQKFAALLREKGYAVSTEAGDDAKADLVLSLVPCAIHGLPYTDGYGVYERSLIGVAIRSVSYACIRMVPLINGESRCDTCNAQSVSDLPFDRMPSSWQFVGPQSREIVLRILKRDIDDVAKAVLGKAGLL